MFYRIRRWWKQWKWHYDVGRHKVTIPHDFQAGDVISRPDGLYEWVKGLGERGEEAGAWQKVQE